MATASSTPYVSVEEYLNTDYRPDVDYIDGHLEERNLGEFDHGTLQGAIYRIFYAKRKRWHIRVSLDTRLRISERSYRVPDVCVMDASLPKEQILREVPMLCIEVLSAKDTLRKMQLRSQDYFAMGVPEVWTFDTERRSVTVCPSGGLATTRSEGLLTLAGTSISIGLTEVFEALDEEQGTFFRWLS